MATPAGERNQRITIEYRASEPKDSQGGTTPTWAVRAVEWAREDQLSYVESIQAAAVTSVRTTAWVIPFRDDLSIKDRVRIGSRTLQILSVTNPDGRREDTRIVCTERVS